MNTILVPNYISGFIVIKYLAIFGCGALTCLLAIFMYNFLYKAYLSKNKFKKMNVCKEKYGNNRLPDDIRNSIMNGLHNYMNESQPWLQLDLTLNELADNININHHQLSQIINTELGKSFACYINEFRVNKACEILIKKQSKSIIAVAFESGFSSKSSFNTVFKKQTGFTPSEYRKKFQASILECV
jgi:YesN/AraC family two-component response regulator